MSDKFLRIGSWILGVIFLITAIASAAQGYPLVAALAGLLGLYLLPPVRAWISAKTNNKIPRGGRIAIAAGLGIAAAIPMSKLGGEMRVEEERLAAIEKEKSDSLEKVRADSASAAEKVSAEHSKDSIDEAAKTKKAFLAAAPYVDALDYNKWRRIAKDSVNDPSLTVESFLASQKKKTDSLRVTRRADSVEHARAMAKIEQQAEAKQRETQQQADRAAARAKTEQTNSNCTYQGHRIIQGPRGGCYYMSGGKKVYIPELSCDGC